jgi:ribosomal protein S18 acetylase RimI-like enzyme
MGDSKITYRKATEADADALVGVINRAFAVELKFFSTERIDRAETLEHFRKGTFLIAEVGGQIAGCVYVSARDARGYFGLLAVEPDHQGVGLGRKLIEDAEEFCRNAGCGVMEIYVLNHRTELPPLYEKLGYSVAGTEEPNPQKPSSLMPYHFILMEKSLS